MELGSLYIPRRSRREDNMFCDPERLQSAVYLDFGKYKRVFTFLGANVRCRRAKYRFSLRPDRVATTLRFRLRERLR